MLTSYIKLIFFKWPIPALLTWGGGWVVFLGLLALNVGVTLAWFISASVIVLISFWTQRWWRKVVLLSGFPVSWALLGGFVVPAWAWLLPMLLLLLIYPFRAWGDAPLFPTPRNALTGISNQIPLKKNARVLDAGSGLGDGLLALRKAFPQARVNGLEWSWLLRILSALRCPWAVIRQGDIWVESWCDYDLIYLFQRPESMHKAMLKAEKELPKGAWVVSLAFEIEALEPHGTWQAEGGRKVWIYQVPLKRRQPLKQKNI